MMWTQIVALAFLALPLTEAQTSNSLRDVILNQNSLSTFRNALFSLGVLVDLLDDLSQNFTVFAPTNDAIAANPTMSMYLEGIDVDPIWWKDHLKATVLNHIISDQILTMSDIFNLQQTALRSMTEDVVVSQWAKQIQGASITQADMLADNGILHIVDHVIQPSFFQHSFADLTLQPEYGPDWLNRTSLLTVVNFTGTGKQALSVARQIGTTFAGCRIRAFNRLGSDYLLQTINRSPSGVIEGEFLNASFKQQTVQEFIEYSLIPGNYYLEDVAEGSEELVFPVNPCSHMWITKQNGLLCFNDGCVVDEPEIRKYLSSNGVGYVVDHCLVCSGIAMLVEYASLKTSHFVHDSAQFLGATEWNLRNMSMSVGNGGSVTMFSSDGTGWRYFTQEDTTRLSTDKWKRHLWDLMKHQIVQGAFNKADLKYQFEQNGEYNLTTLNGENITIGYDATKDTVLIDGGDVYFTDIQGVDGMVHFTNKVALPVSVTHTVYDLAREMANFSTQVNYIDTVGLTNNFLTLSPVTCFFAPNPAFEGLTVGVKDIGPLVENHVFEDLLWCERLLSKNGTSIESRNGRTWNISVNDDGFPCLDTVPWSATSPSRACVTTCDYLVRNGIVHALDAALFQNGTASRDEYGPNGGGTSPPQPAPSIGASGPVSWTRPTATASNPSAFSPSAFSPSAEFPTAPTGGSSSNAVARRLDLMILAMVALLLLKF